MQVVFYGTARQIGTSANMTAVAAALTYYFEWPVLAEEAEKPGSSISKEIILTDCTCRSDAEKMINGCDLLVLNLSVPNRELEEVYLRHALVRKNVIFLFGKYFPYQSNEIKRLAEEYRMNCSRICMIPYDPGFGYAYEKRQVLDYIKNCPFAGSYRNIQFTQKVKRTAETILTYGNRKGEIYYG